MPWKPRASTLLALLAVVATLLACSKKSSRPTATTPPVSQAVALETVSSALNTPVFLTAPPGDATRLFVIEKGGTIRVILNGTLLDTPFLDLSARVSHGQEQGLLGMAFDPNYATNKRFFVSWTDSSNQTRIERFLVSSDPNIANATPDAGILTVPHIDDLHNGGMIAFGPDGKLYISIGDGNGGNGGGDPAGNGQNLDVLLGKLLRIDVSGSGYTVPADNPFVGVANTQPEIWSYGLRNPWRFSFDRGTGDLYIGDVGQDQFEEVDVVTNASGRGKGLNFGWHITEGTHCFSPSSGCDRTGLTAPALDYSHASGGCAVMGGYVYRGSALPWLHGIYFYGDYCDGNVRSFVEQGGAPTQQKTWPELSPGTSITSFGEDSRGELYVLTHGGTVYRIVSAP